MVEALWSCASLAQASIGQYLGDFDWLDGGPLSAAAMVIPDEGSAEECLKQVVCPHGKVTGATREGWDRRLCEWRRHTMH